MQLRDVLAAMDKCLSESTGLKELDRKVIIYYAISTHALPLLHTFPLLVLAGKTGTGKSQAEKITARYSRQPRSLCLRGMTLPAIRDEFAIAHEGTAVLEEPDQAWKDGDGQFENLLSDRYQRDTARAVFKTKTQQENWALSNVQYFGATVLHRRVPFHDAAMDGRCVRVQFHADYSRQYTEFTESGKPIQIELPELPEMKAPAGIAARVFNSHRPLLAVARLCGDDGFVSKMQDRLARATDDLREAQATEPDALVLRAIIASVHTNGYGYVRVSQVVKTIFDNDKVQLHPRQVGSLARGLGLTTKLSHGVTVIDVQPAALLRACRECGYQDDEALAEVEQQCGNG
jgi:hypothetical protein